jgi:hypothetical protein
MKGFFQKLYKPFLHRNLAIIKVNSSKNLLLIRIRMAKTPLWRLSNQLD